jgi:hypothetical protein
LTWKAFEALLPEIHSKPNKRERREEDEVQKEGQDRGNGGGREGDESNLFLQSLIVHELEIIFLF